MIKIVYFGTHGNAAAILSELAKADGMKIQAVITSPDRPAGRNHEPLKSPVKIVAENLKLPILQPDDLKTFNPPEADLHVICAYGVIVPKRILDMPKFGNLNIHYSLLPKYRGAAPFQTALINGDKVTGVTIMLLDEKMDHGPILEQLEVEVNEDDTASILSEKLNNVAIPLLISTIPRWVNGEIEAKPQDHAQASYCKLFTRDDGKVDWSKSATEIYNQFRGLSPWPGIWTTWNNKRLKLLDIKKTIKKTSEKAGTVIAEGAHMYIQTGDGLLQVAALQLEGAKAMDSKTFINGYKQIVGALLQ